MLGGGIAENFVFLVSFSARKIHKKALRRKEISIKLRRKFSLLSKVWKENFVCAELQEKSWENKRLWFLSKLLPIDEFIDVSCAYSSALRVDGEK